MLPDLHRDNVLSTVRRRLSLVVAFVHCIGWLGVLRLRLLDILFLHQGKLNMFDANR